MTHNFTTNCDTFGTILLTFFKKILLEGVGEGGWVYEYFITHPPTYPNFYQNKHFQCQNEKKNKQENKNTKKEKESKDDKRTSVKKKI